MGPKHGNDRIAAEVAGFCDQHPRLCIRRQASTSLSRSMRLGRAISVRHFQQHYMARGDAIAQARAHVTSRKAS